MINGKTQLLGSVISKCKKFYRNICLSAISYCSPQTGLDKNLNKKYKKYFRGFISPIVIVTTCGLIFGLRQYTVNNQRQRQAATIEYLIGFRYVLATTDPMLLDTMNIFGYKGKYTTLDTSTLETLLKNNTVYRRQLDNILTYLNRFAIGCSYDDYFDENAAWAADYNIIVNATYALVPFFQIIERERGNKANQFVCPFLRALVYRWETDKSMNKKYNNKLNKIDIDKFPTIKGYLFPPSGH